MTFRNSMNCLFLSATLGIVSIGASSLAADQKPTQEERLQKLLERFPKADSNGDGVLTAEEAKAFRAQQPKKPAKEKKADKSNDTSMKGPQPTFENVSYGPHERNVLDVWQAKSDKPTPIIVFIHGGGFVNGDKTKIRGNSSIQKALDQGISFASINYRFRAHAPVQDILRDSARAIQFIRSKAKEWNIDPTKIAAYGSSAGAGTSLWLAFHDDLANPKSDDPVQRESSRLSAVGALNTQASYDLRDWEQIVGKSPVDRSQLESLMFYGFKSKEDYEKPEADAIMKDVSMINLISEGDAPVALFTAQPNTEPKDRGHYVHHPRHAIAVAERAKEKGIDTLLILQDDAKKAKSGESQVVDFLIKKLKGDSSAAAKPKASEVPKDVKTTAKK